MTMPYEEVAPRLKALREAADLSLAELAVKTETPEANVARYETGTVEIPVSYLFKVAQACRVDLTALLSGGEAHLKGYSLIRAGKGLSVERRKDYDYKSLAYRFTGRKMEPFLVSVPPKEEHELGFSSHPGQEFIFMLQGRLELRLGENVLTLEQGDSLYFDAHQPHALRSLGEDNATFLDVII